MDTLLTDLQQDVAGRLQADSYLRDILVLTERRGDITADIQRSLGLLTSRYGGMGACIVIMQPVASVDQPNLPHPVMEIEIFARVLEHVIVNTGTKGSGKPALDIARRVARLLHLYRPGGIAHHLVAQSPTIVPVSDPLASLAYEVRFSATEADDSPDSKVSVPAISVAGTSAPWTVTLSCATAGVDIYYTTDRSYPASTNPAAILYTSAITIQRACTLRACAVKSGALDSDVASASITAET